MAMPRICKPDLDAFIDLSWDVNARDSLWIPPLRARLRQELTGKDAFGEYGKLQMFGCETDGRLVGRIAAIINPRLLDSAGHPVGQVGYFEAVDDDTVASNLFGAAFDWLRSQGARQVWGPMNGGPHRLHRFMIEGFDRSPFLFEPRNPAYYPRLFEAAGFSPIFTWFAIDTSSDRLREVLATERMLRVRKGTSERYEVVRLEPSDAAAALVRIHAFLDAMWAGHVGYTSLDFGEFAELFAPGLALMTVGDIHVAIDRATGRDAGCVFSYPDYAAEVRALGGDAGGWGRWLLNGMRPRRLVLHTVGLSPEARGSGLVSAMLRAVFQHCVDEYAEGVLAPMVPELTPLQKIGSPTRRYALYGRPIH